MRWQGPQAWREVLASLDDGRMNPFREKLLVEWFSVLTDIERLAVWSKLSEGGIDKLERTKKLHRCLAALILEVFQMPMGSAGVGKVPMPRDPELKKAYEDGVQFHTLPGWPKL